MDGIGAIVFIAFVAGSLFGNGIEKAQEDKAKDEMKKAKIEIVETEESAQKR